MSKTMAEVLRETMRDHRVLWEIGIDDDRDLVAKCESCGYLSAELDTWEHQSNVAAEVLSAAGFGLVTDAKAERGWLAKNRNPDGSVSIIGHFKTGAEAEKWASMYPASFVEPCEPVCA